MVAIVLVLPLMSEVSPGGQVARAASELVAHDAITINSLDDFTAENGVVSGDGSAEDPFVIEGIDIGSGEYGVAADCISLWNVDAHVVIRDVYLHSGDCGIRMYNCSNISVLDSYIFSNHWSEVDILFSDHITFHNCTILADTESQYPGFAVDRSYYLTITGNTFGGKGITFEPEGGLYDPSPDVEFASHVITPDNLLDGDPILYYSDQPALEVDGVTAGQVILADCDSAAVTGLTISGGDVAVFAVNSPGVRISNCTVSDASTGIRVHNSPECTVSGNEVEEASYAGIWVSKGCNGSTVADNYLSFCGDYGLRVEMCSSTVSGNEVHMGGHGISVGYYVGPVTVRDNTVTGCRGGITAANFYSESLVIEGNHVERCTRGIRVGLTSGAEVSDNNLTENDYGIMLESCSNCSVHDNRVADGDYGIYLTFCDGVEVYDNDLVGVAIETYDDNEGENSWDTEGYTLGMVAVVVAVSLLVVVLLAAILYRRRKAA